MADHKLSAKEAALLAAARAGLQNEPPAAAVPRAPADPAPMPAAPESNADPAQRIAALMEIARAESERLRRKQRQLYVWIPAAFMTVVGLWTLLWLWHRL